MESPALKAAREAVNAATNDLAVTTTDLAATVQPIADYEAELASKLTAGMSVEEQAVAAVTLQANADGFKSINDGLQATAAALRALGSTPTV